MLVRIFDKFVLNSMMVSLIEIDTALERVPRQLLPNPCDVGPLQLSSIASSAREQSKVQTAAKPTKVQAPKFQTARCKGGSLENDDGDDSSWGDGTSTEEV
jgi:hypothetical protein